jgi:hypothetical protein
MFRKTRDFTRIRTAAAGEQPPDLGQVSELIRNTLTKEYNIFPPNLSTAIQDDQTIIITAVNLQTGLNLRITLANLAGNFIHPGGTMAGVVPASPAFPGPGIPPATGGIPPASPGMAGA